MNKSKPSQMTRREFVLAAPALVAAASLGGLGQIASAAAAPLHQDSAARLSIAYLEGSEQWDNIRCLAPIRGLADRETTMDRARLVPAQDVSSGDGRFSRLGARVTIHGILGEAPDNLPEMEVKALYRPFHELQAMLWGFQGSPAHSVQPATSFPVPIDAATGLQLAVDMRPRRDRSRETPAETAEARFTLGAFPGEAKLRRGIYLLAWDLAAAPALPDWDRYHAVTDHGGEAVEGLTPVRRLAIADRPGQVNRVPVLVMSVDHADGVAT